MGKGFIFVVYRQVYKIISSIIYIEQNPAEGVVYKEHLCTATIARMSPSGDYIASGGK